MIISGPNLKTILKRDISLDNWADGACTMRSHCIELNQYSIEPESKPGLFAATAKTVVVETTYVLLVEYHPLLLANCEVSGPRVIDPANPVPIKVFIRPADKSIKLDELPYLARLYVIDGRVKL